MSQILIETDVGDQFRNLLLGKLTTPTKWTICTLRNFRYIELHPDYRYSDSRLSQQLSQARIHTHYGNIDIDFSRYKVHLEVGDHLCKNNRLL